jgi:hypothetical protein
MNEYLTLTNLGVALGAIALAVGGWLVWEAKKPPKPPTTKKEETK